MQEHPAALRRLHHAIIEFYEKLSSWEHDAVREQGLALPQIHTLGDRSLARPSKKDSSNSLNPFCF